MTLQKVKGRRVLSAPTSRKVGTVAKKKLSLDDLKVESFQTTPEENESGEGTVFGFGAYTEETACVGSTCGYTCTCITCVATCRWTCGWTSMGTCPASCDTCGSTCLC